MFVLTVATFLVHEVPAVFIICLMISLYFMISQPLGFCHSIMKSGGAWLAIGAGGAGSLDESGSASASTSRTTEF